jgi:hypothetical protein
MLRRLKSEGGVVPVTVDESVALEELQAAGLASASPIVTVDGTEWVLR